MCKWWFIASVRTKANCLHGVIQKRSLHFQRFILQKLLTLNPCAVFGWKGNLSKFWYLWSEAVHHWGCGFCYLWHAATSLGTAGLSIWHLPRHMWGSHRVLVRCENNFEGSSFSLYITCRRMFNSDCKINFWKCILLFEQPCINEYGVLHMHYLTLLHYPQITVLLLPLYCISRKKWSRAATLLDLNLFRFALFTLLVLAADNFLPR
jgi:hypothetical protein